ncbi:MAG: ethanolamine utilization protein EutH [Bacteroidaceae bacterium]|nr:ethanolamine utilization protein EutH [Bacteroidaceae bacterium]
MTINQIIMYILAFGAALGGIDLMIGNKLGYGEKFENGFRMLGPVALAMAGIICLAPVLSAVLGVMVTPLCNLLNLDPGIFGSILAIDMGGCQLAVDLAKDPEFGLFSGVIISSIFGKSRLHLCNVNQKKKADIYFVFPLAWRTFAYCGEKCSSMQKIHHGEDKFPV